MRKPFDSQRQVLVSFGSALELAELLSTLPQAGEEIFVLKTELGPLLGELRFSAGDHDGCFSIFSNKSLFICCDKKVTDYTFSTVEYRRHQSNKFLSNYSNQLELGVDSSLDFLGGFSSKSKFRQTLLPGGSRINTYYRLMNACSSCFVGQSIRFMEIAAQCNIIRSRSGVVNSFTSVVKSVLGIDCSTSSAPRELSNEDRDHIDGSLERCFQDILLEQIPLKLTLRHSLCTALVAWGYRNAHLPQGREKVLSELYTTRASLSLACKEMLNLGPMNILRFIRLDLAHHALRFPSVRQRLGLDTVGGIREYYRFTSRGNFAGLYYEYFGEKPGETLLKS